MNEGEMLGVVKLHHHIRELLGGQILRRDQVTFRADDSNHGSTFLLLCELCRVELRNMLDKH